MLRCNIRYTEATIGIISNTLGLIAGYHLPISRLPKIERRLETRKINLDRTFINVIL